MKTRTRVLAAAAALVLPIALATQTASAGASTFPINPSPNPVTQGGTLTVSGNVCPNDGGTITVTISIADLSVTDAAATVTGSTYTLDIPIAANAPIGSHGITGLCVSNSGQFPGSATFSISAAPTTTAAATTTTGGTLAETGTGGSSTMLAVFALVAVLLGGGLVLVAHRARRHV